MPGAPGPARQLAALVSAFRPALVCVTLGKEGRLAFVDGTEIRTFGFELPVVDTTGAGGVFRGGFIAAWLGAGLDPEAKTVVAYTHAVAALKCRGLGAQTAIPRPDEVAGLSRNG